jgi:hypothetical protein
MHEFLYMNFHDDNLYIRQLSELLVNMGALQKGIALRDAVFDEENPLPGKVFAVELLNSPIHIDSTTQKRSVVLRRDNVRLGAYTPAGRNYIVEQAFPDDDSREQAKTLDTEIHRVLLGLTREKKPLNQKNMRWASGGVLSRVEYRGRNWFSFFFRDYPPYGWNISLGASEREEELIDPWKFIMREFLEETLICRPARHGRAVVRRPLVFDRLNIKEEIEQAERFSKKHRDLRYRRDCMNFVEEPGAPVGCQIQPTKTTICIDGDSEVEGVLVCVNLTELGIEVLKVVRYEISDRDYILDGEIYEPARDGVNGIQQRELVRMPVALISEEYCKKAFGKAEKFEYVLPFDAKVPSILGPPIPEKDIVIFPHDVRRRVELVENTSETATKWEQERYSLWLENFGSNFINAEGEPCSSNASRLFTPASAKAITYYFANI